MPKASVNGFQLYYEIEGHGEPVILIPGFASGHEIWSRQTPELSRNFRIITFDPRGVAASDNAEGKQSIGLLADDVARMLQALGIARAHVLGTSFGGFVAQEFALNYPSMTNRLVLCCTSFGGPNHVMPGAEALEVFASARGLNASQFEAALSFDVESRVEEIRSPTLVVSGDADAFVPVQNSRNLAAKIPGAQLRVVEGGSHTFFIEQADEFNKIVTAFLRDL